VASRGLEKGFKGASRGLEKGFKGLQGGFKGASRGLQAFLTFVPPSPLKGTFEGGGSDPAPLSESAQMCFFKSSAHIVRIFSG